MKSKTTNPKKLRRQARADGLTPRNSPVQFSLMAKPIGPACNLRCRYCFYLEKDALFADGEDYRMSPQVLEALVRKYIESEPANEVTFHWQGGEPTLMGVEFFRKAMQLQRHYANGKRIHNTLQTNATLLDDEWGRMLHENHWLVGASLDGPEDVHNAFRLTADGRGAFEAARRGLDILLKHQVEFNVLASITPVSTADPLRVFRFFREAGVKFLQFTPVVERVADDAAAALGLQLAVGIRQSQAHGKLSVGVDGGIRQGEAVAAPGTVAAPEVTPWSVRPDGYGEFLCRIFDDWIGHDVGSMFVMNFEWAFAGYLGLPPRVCQFMPVCGRSPIIEHNGDIYACDHYVYPEYRLGNILTDDLQEMVQSRAQCAFGMAKHESLPSCCQECPVLPACQGECPKRRFLQAPDGSPGLNYLCAAYKRFLTHAAPYFEAIDRLRRTGRPASDIMQTQVVVVPSR